MLFSLCEESPECNLRMLGEVLAMRLRSNLGTVYEKAAFSEGGFS